MREITGHYWARYSDLCSSLQPNAELMVLSPNFGNCFKKKNEKINTKVVKKKKKIVKNLNLFNHINLYTQITGSI
jgi:hypothetical protein